MAGDSNPNDGSLKTEKKRSRETLIWSLVILTTACFGITAMISIFVGPGSQHRFKTRTAKTEEVAIRTCEGAVSSDFRNRFGKQAQLAFSRRTAKYLEPAGQWIVTAEFDAAGSKRGSFSYACRVMDTGELVVLPPDSFENPVVFAETSPREQGAPATGSPGRGMTDQDIDRLTTYSLALGRASGCGIDVTPEGQRVSAWLLARVKPGFEERFYPNLLMTGVIEARDAQLAGHSPDGCDQVRRSFARFRWP